MSLSVIAIQGERVSVTLFFVRMGMWQTRLEFELCYAMCYTTHVCTLLHLNEQNLLKDEPWHFLINPK